jgi:hypothetical protein
MIREIDEDGNGEIDFDEFVQVRGLAGGGCVGFGIWPSVCKFLNATYWVSSTIVWAEGRIIVLGVVSRIGHAMTSVLAGDVEKGSADLHAGGSQGRIQGV